MGNYKFEELSANEMEETFAGCIGCSVVDLVAEVIKIVIHK